jgi:hypothetical protein
MTEIDYTGRRPVAAVLQAPLEPPAPRPFLDRGRWTWARPSWPPGRPYSPEPTQGRVPGTPGRHSGPQPQTRPFGGAGR